MTLLLAIHVFKDQRAAQTVSGVTMANRFKICHACWHSRSMLMFNAVRAGKSVITKCCAPCLERASVYRQAKRSKLGENQCVSCGGRKSDASMKQCSRCRRNDREKSLIWRTNNPERARVESSKQATQFENQTGVGGQKQTQKAGIRQKILRQASR